MKKLCVAGPQDFLVGFKLAGISHTRLIEKNEKEEVLNILKETEVGILVLPQEIVDKLPEHIQSDLTKSVQPVVVVLSKQTGASHLRQDIIRAIGVDLWKGE